MTPDDWTRVEPIATQALALSPDEQRALIESAGLSEPIRFELLAALHRLRQSSSVAVAGSPTPVPLAGGGRSGPPRPPLPVLTPGAPLDDGRYIVVRQIGRGGMGTVFLAHDTKLGQLVALKVTAHDQHVLAEARRAAACSGHPHVATIHDVFDQEIDGRTVGVLVMEYVAGTPASRILDDGPVAVARALRWGRQVAEAVAHAHDHQVLHCDLKPANIIITPDDNAKVLDFGIARATFDPSDPAEPLRGTIPYMAPEQLLAKEFSPAGDIYSLGVTLFELITGRLPFEGDDAALRLRIVVAPPPSVVDLVPAVPPQLHSVIERALSKEPQRRYRSARSFERALDSVETGLHHTTATVPVPVPTPIPTPIWSKVGVATVAAGAVLIGMTSVGALTTAVYDMTLERSAFANETVVDWFHWGRRASFTPFAWLVILVAGCVPILFLRRVAVSLSATAARIDESLTSTFGALRRRLGFEDATTVAAYLLVAFGTAIIASCIYFWPLLSALMDFVSIASPQKLAVLADDEGHRAYHSFYRGTFTTIVIGMAAGWYALLAAMPGRPRLHWSLYSAGAAMMIVALVLLHAPYRLVNYRNNYEVVEWKGQRCYVFGEGPAGLSLFCPQHPSPRRIVVDPNDRSLLRAGATDTDPFKDFTADQDR